MEPNAQVPNSYPNVPIPVNPASGESGLQGPVDLLVSSWKFYKENWKMFSLIAIIAPLISFVGILIGTAEVGALNILMIVLLVAAVIIGIATQPTLVGAIQRHSTRTEPDLPIKEQYRRGFKFFWSIILIGIISGFVTLGSALLLVIPAIIVSIYVVFSVFALVLDGQKGFAALTYSYGLVRGRWWKVLGRLAWMILVYVVVAIIVGLIISIFTGFDRAIVPSPGSNLISMVFNLIVQAVFAPLMTIYLFKMYVSLRESKNPAVQTGAFKKWLIAFLVIGIIGLILIPIVGGVFAYQVIKNFGDVRSNANIQLNGEQLQLNDRQLQEEDVRKLLDSLQQSTNVQQ